MGTLARTLLAIAGLDKPSPPVRPQRRRQAANGAGRPVRDRATKHVPVSSRPLPNPGYAGGFEEIAGRSAPAPSGRSVPVRKAAAPRPAGRRLGTMAMTLLAGLFLACGGWVGGQVQAITLGQAHQEPPVDPNLAKPVPGPAFTF